MATTQLSAQNNGYDHKTVRDLRVQIYYQFENCVDVLVALTGTVCFIGNKHPLEEVEIGLSLYTISDLCKLVSCCYQN
jgi:hypothetical protein